MNVLTSGSFERLFAHAEAHAPLQVVIAYDGISAAQHALDVLNGLSPREGATARVAASTWWFRFLEDPDVRAKATAAAANADLLVIAANGEVELPNAVESWLESSLAAKHRPDLAVVALRPTEERGRDTKTPWIPFVRRLTRETGACFLTPFARRRSGAQLSRA